MLVSLDAIPQTPCALPDLTVLNPKKKDKAYCIQYGRGFLTAYRNSGSTDFFNGREKYAELDRYANGDNEVKSALKKREGDANNKIDFRPLPLLHKPLMAVEGTLKEHSYEVTITPVDAVSQNERSEYEAKMRAWMAQQAFMQSIGLDQPGGPGADIPVDDDDLAMHMDVSYKIREAIDMEQKVAYGMYLADYARQDQQCSRDEAVKGPSVIFMQRRSRTLRLPVRKDPGECFILPSRSEDFPNLQAGAHIERLSLGQVLAEIDDDKDTTLSDTDRRNLEQLATASQAGTNGGGSYYLDTALGSKPEITGEIKVLRFAFLSTDRVVKKELTDKDGNVQIFDMDADYVGPNEGSPTKSKDVKIHRQLVQTWYEGTIVLGSDIGYGCRPAYGQLRDEDNPFACLPLYIVNAPGMMGGKIKSMVERCKIAVDIASRAVVKMQHAEAKWWDLTVKLNRNALMEAAIDGAGGKVLTRAEVVKELISENIIVGDEFDDQGNQLGEVLKFIETPLGNAVVRHWQTIQNAKNEIADITGINGAISGDDPASRQGQGVTELAIQGSQNALNHLFVAKKSRFERVAKAIAASIKSGEDKGTAPLTGVLLPAKKNGKPTQLTPNEEVAKRKYAYKIEQKPTAEQWATFYSSANQSLAQKEITLADMAFLYTVDNLKQARYLLAARAKRNEMKAAQQAEANSKMQGEQAAMAAQAKGDEDRKLDDQQTENKLRVIDRQGEWALRAVEAQNDKHLQATQIVQGAGLQKQQNEHAHAATMADAADEHDLAKHDATLSSAEQEAAAQRAHEIEVQSMQPEPATA